jgi:hypothetical protein
MFRPSVRRDFIGADMGGRSRLGRERAWAKTYELVEDERNPGRVYLNEAYDHLMAFKARTAGPFFRRTFDVIGEFRQRGAFVSSSAPGLRARHC